MDKLIKLLARLGVMIEKRDGVSISFSSKFKTTLIVAGVAGFVFLVAMVQYTQTSGFCKSCHIMEPYYEAWKASTHGHVACVKCHYPPVSSGVGNLLWRKFQAISEVVKYVTRTYAPKPHADVPDASCLQCHPDRLLDGWVEVGDKGVRFDHKPHLTETRRDRQLRCTSCHSQVMVGGGKGTHMQVTYDTCYTCHFKGLGTGKNLKPLGGCLSCHKLPTKDFKLAGTTYNHKELVSRKGVSCMDCHLGVVSGEGAALKDRCFTCHNDPKKLEKYGDIPFLHENHVTKHHVACFQCHQKMEHGFDAQAKNAEHLAVEHAATPSAHHIRQGVDCSNCHQDKHSAQLLLYSGKLPEELRTKGKEDIQSPMFSARVACTGCHYDDKAGNAGYGGHTQKFSPDACRKCHGEKFNDGLAATKADVASGLAALEEKIAAAKTALGNSQAAAAAKAKAKSAVEKASRSAAFLRAAHGEHNVYLASVLLREADAGLDSAAAALGAALPDISAQPLISGAYCSTQCHEAAGVKVPPEKVKSPASAGIASIAGKSMPHKDHAGMMGCVKCHDLGGHRKAPLRRDYRETCKQCHS